MDDPKIVYSAPEKLEGTLAEMKRLGADRIRVSVFWHLLAPEPKSRDAALRGGRRRGPAQLLGREVGPLRPDRHDGAEPRLEDPLQRHLAGSALGDARHRRAPTSRTATGRTPTEFGDFVEAVGTRYSGTFQDEAARQSTTSLFDDCKPTPNFPVPPPVCPPDAHRPDPGQPQPAEHGPGPAARRHLVDLERAEHARLADAAVARGRQAGSPRRRTSTAELADAMYRGLRESGHGSDTILLAETAPRGARERAVTQSLPPLLFIRELYCLDRRFRPFTGDAAARRDCPDGGDGFREAHPVLFDATAFAHHPYAFEAPPRRSDTTRTTPCSPTSAGSRARSIARSRATARPGATRCGSPSTATRPIRPTRTSGWSWKTQARFLAQAEWLAYRQPARTLDRAVPALRRRAPARLPGGRPAPLGHVPDRPADGGREEEDGLRGLPAPIFVTAAAAGPAWRVFGLYRPATGRRRGGGPVQAQRGEALAGRSKRARRTERATSLTKVKVAGSGVLRIVFGDMTTRAARVRG